MKKQRPREPLDWHRSIEDHGPHHPPTVAEEMLSLLPGRISRPIIMANSIYGLLKNDTAADNGAVQRCPRCNHRALRRLRPDEKTAPDDSNWHCSRCGNDKDEFGNKL